MAALRVAVKLSTTMRTKNESQYDYVAAVLGREYTDRKRRLSTGTRRLRDRSRRE